jgi:hypothetical protein
LSQNLKRRDHLEDKLSCVDNIKVDLRGIGWEALEWIHLAHDMDVLLGLCEHGHEPPGSIKGGKLAERLLASVCG